MKRILLSLLTCGIINSSFAQIEPALTCCNVVAGDMQKSIVIARDFTTGRFYQFKADALDMRTIKLNDSVGVSAGKVTSINGEKRTYAAVKPDPVLTCCNIVSMRPDPVLTCCNMVTIKNNTTKASFTISVPKQIAATLKTGQAVSMDASTGMAIVQSSYGDGKGQMNSYGYGVISGK